MNKQLGKMIYFKTEKIKWILQSHIPANVRDSIKKKISWDAYILVNRGREEAWKTLFSISSKIREGLANEKFTQ
jgi:hypothetical protein